MEVVKKKMECGINSERKEEVVKWFQPHMINFYSVFVLSVICFISCNNILRLHVFTPLENIMGILFMAILIIMNLSMWNNCMIRQSIEELKSELKELK